MILPERNHYGNCPEGAEEIQALLSSLRAAFAASPSPSGPMPETLALTPEVQQTWQHLQKIVPSESREAADIACLLAYYGIDYNRNVRRLLRPYTLQRSERIGHKEPTREYADEQEGNCLPGHLARIYDRWRDPTVLRWLLGSHLPDMEGRAEEHQALIDLWDDHWIALLQAASQSAGRRSRLASALLYACHMAEEPLIWRAYARHLQRALYSRDLPLRKTALKLLAHLRRRYPLRSDAALTCTRRKRNYDFAER